MRFPLGRAEAVLGAQILAFWPVWRWYARRVNDSPEDAWGLAALVTALVLFLRDRRGGGSVGLAPAAMTLAYAGAYPFLPPLLRAVMALAAIGATLRSWGMGNGAAFQAFGLLLLSLPVIPSLQFFLGYPMRIVVGSVTTGLLNMAGFSVVREGVGLLWQGNVIWIDAPCSGIKMMWVLFYLAFLLAAMERMDARRSMMMVASAGAAALAGNVMRMSSLFFMELGLWPMPEWAHAGTGVVSLLLVGVGMVGISRWLQKPEVDLCAPGFFLSFPAR